MSKQFADTKEETHYNNFHQTPMAYWVMCLLIILSIAFVPMLKILGFWFCLLKSDILDTSELFDLHWEWCSNRQKRLVCCNIFLRSNTECCRQSTLMDAEPAIFLAQSGSTVYSIKSLIAATAYAGFSRHRQAEGLSVPLSKDVNWYVHHIQGEDREHVPWIQ